MVVYQNQVEQYGRRNNIVITGLPDNIADATLDVVTFIMEDIDVVIQDGDIEACHRIGKSDKKTSSKKNHCSIF